MRLIEKLNNKGFAISGILYSLLILVVTLMFLVLAILSARRTTLNALNNGAIDSVENRVMKAVRCTEIKFDESTFYNNRNGKYRYEVPLSKGYYLIQVWGSSGNNSVDNNFEGGKGAYVSAIYEVKSANQKIYISIGNTKGKVTSGGKLKGYGGGGVSFVSTYQEGTLSLANLTNNRDTILLVAAGGGTASTSGNGGAGGDLVEGVDGEGEGAGQGATAEAGGIGGVGENTSYSGKQGKFATGGSLPNVYEDGKYSGGGGDGYYGGGSGATKSLSGYAIGGAGGGGVSYVREDLIVLTDSIKANGGILNSYEQYKKYIGVGISGIQEMPKYGIYTDESILTATQPVGNTGVGGVRITPMICSK